MTESPLRVIQSGVATFFGRPMATLDTIGSAKCAIAGVPWDEGNAGRNGANYGPRTFRDASSWFLGYNAQEDYDLWEQFPTVDLGDVPVMPPNAARTMDLIADHVGAVRSAGVFPLLVGGNHSLAIGAARGAAGTVAAWDICPSTPTSTPQRTGTAKHWSAAAPLPARRDPECQCAQRRRVRCPRLAQPEKSGRPRR